MNPETGIIFNSSDYQQFVKGTNSGDVADFAATPLGSPGMDGVEFPQWQSQIARDEKATVRGWESQGRSTSSCTDKAQGIPRLSKFRTHKQKLWHGSSNPSLSRKFADRSWRCY